MKPFFIAADPSASAALSLAVRTLGGRPFSCCSWITEWPGTADALCRELRRHTVHRVFVCALDDDWSYR